MTLTTELIPAKRESRALVPVAPNLEQALEHEIATNCKGKVSKRLALKLALSLISEQKGGTFYAEKLAHQLQVRLRYDAALRAVYLERKEK